MTVSQEYVEYIIEKLETCLDVEKARFFGGVGIKHNNLQFAMIMGSTFYLCVNDTTREKYVSMDSEPFSYLTKKGRIFVRKYYSVPEDIIEDQDTLSLWCSEALDAALKGKK